MAENLLNFRFRGWHGRKQDISLVVFQAFEARLVLFGVFSEKLISACYRTTRFLRHRHTENPFSPPGLKGFCHMIIVVSNTWRKGWDITFVIASPTPLKRLRFHAVPLCITLSNILELQNIL